MSTIYFKKALVDTALNTIKLKGAVDKLKAKDDIDQIDAVLTRYKWKVIIYWQHNGSAMLKKVSF